MISMEDLLENPAGLFDEENFIGIGSTRKVYRRGDIVIKMHLHKLGCQACGKE